MNKCNDCFHNKVCKSRIENKELDTCDEYIKVRNVAVMPCGIGDTVWFVESREVLDDNYLSASSDWSDCGFCHVEYSIVPRRLTSEREIFHYIREFEKTIFLTEDEAREEVNKRVAKL